jgi:ParB family chromosome partitioning protein
VASKSAVLARDYVPRARESRDLADLVQAARSTSRLRSNPVDAIAFNPRNPRVVFSEQAINELVQSLREDGQLQPVLARELQPKVDGAHFELIAGE